MKANDLLFVVLAISVLILVGCASYKPSAFDSQTKRYNDYKNNYSIEILDEYALLSKEAKENLGKTFINNVPADTAVFFNKKNESILAMWVLGSFPARDKNEKEAILSTLSKNLNSNVLEQKAKVKAEIHENKKLLSENAIICEYSIVTEFGEAKLIFKIVLFPLSTKSNNHSVYILAGSSKPNFFEETKKDHLKMSSTLVLLAFSERERSLNSSKSSELSKEIIIPESNLNKKPPESIKQEIKQKCAAEFPSDYAKQVECVKKQESAWMELNR